MAGFGLNIQSTRPIGVDIGHSSIKMIQLAVTGERINVTAADCAPVKPALHDNPAGMRDFTVSAIKKMLSNGKFRGTKVNSCLPGEALKITSLRLNDLEQDQLERIINTEARKRFGLDAAKDTVDYMLAGSIRQGDEIKKELILFGAEQKTVNQHIRMLEDAGLDPLSIDIVPCALFRCFAKSLRRQEDKDQTIIFVDVGSSLTTVVFGREGNINFTKKIPVGADKFDREIAARAGVTFEEAVALRQKLQQEKKIAGKKENADSENPKRKNKIPDPSTRQTIIDAINSVAEELAKEISLCFRYYTVTFRGKRVNRAFIAGGGAHETVLINVLKRQLPVEVEVAEPLRGIDISAIANHDDEPFSEWAVAAGLGLKGLSHHFLDSRSKVYERN